MGFLPNKCTTGSLLHTAQRQPRTEEEYFLREYLRNPDTTFGFSQKLFPLLKSGVLTRGCA